MRTITLQELNAEAFAPYGEVFAPLETGERVDRVAELQNKRAAAKPNLFLARSGLTTLPHRFDRMESHPESSQSFMPFGTATMVVAAALPGPDGQPDLSTLKAFTSRGLGFSYRAGVWHLPVSSLGDTVPVAGFMYEAGTPQDTVWAETDPITLEA